MDNYNLALKFYKKMVDYLKDDISSIHLYFIVFKCIKTHFNYIFKFQQMKVKLLKLNILWLYLI